MRGMARAAATAALLALAAPASADDPSGTIGWVTYPETTAAWLQSAAFGRALERSTGARLDIIVESEPAARIRALVSGRAEAAALGSEAVHAQEGLFDFADGDLGPQPLALLLQGIGGSAVTLIAAGDSGIERLADLRGHRVARLGAAPALDHLTGALLAFGGLRWSDIEPYRAESWGTLAEAAESGMVDAFLTAPHAPENAALERSARGMRLLEVPTADRRGWQRLERRAPWLSPLTVVRDDVVLEVAGVPHPNIVVRADADPDRVYRLARALHRLFPDYAFDAPGAEGWSLTRQRLDRAFLPVHPGAARYLDEVGAWQVEHALRAEMLRERQAVLAEAWRRTRSIEAWPAMRAAALAGAGLATLVDDR